MFSSVAGKKENFKYRIDYYSEIVETCLIYFDLCSVDINDSIYYAYAENGIQIVKKDTVKWHLKAVADIRMHGFHYLLENDDPCCIRWWHFVTSEAGIPTWYPITMHIYKNITETNQHPSYTINDVLLSNRLLIDAVNVILNKRYMSLNNLDINAIYLQELGI